MPRQPPKETGLCGEGSNRVKRGGSWNNNAVNCRVSNRNNNNPDNRNNNLGFRVACSTKGLTWIGRVFEQPHIAFREK